MNFSVSTTTNSLLRVTSARKQISVKSIMQLLSRQFQLKPFWIDEGSWLDEAMIIQHFEASLSFMMGPSGDEPRLHCILWWLSTGRGEWVGYRLCPQEKMCEACPNGPWFWRRRVYQVSYYALRLISSRWNFLSRRKFYCLREKVSLWDWINIYGWVTFNCLKFRALRKFRWLEICLNSQLSVK